MPPRNNAPSDIKLLQDANSAAAALQAALGAPLEATDSRSGRHVAVPEEPDHSLDSVANLHEASPEKKARLTSSSKIPRAAAPNFGGRGDGGGISPPVPWRGFRGCSSHRPRCAKCCMPFGVNPPTGPPLPAGPGPQRFDLDEPSWVGSLRMQLNQLVQTQVGMQTQLEESGRSLRNLQSDIRQLGVGQDNLSAGQTRRIRPSSK